MAYDLLLNDNKDLIIESGDLVTTTSNAQLLKQRMEITFHTLVGEWYLNINYGTYDIGLFTSKSLTKPQMDAYFINLIKSFDEVESLMEYQGVFDAANREYSLQFRVRAEDTVVPIAISLTPPGVDTVYQDTDYKFPPKGCDIPETLSTNRFYELIHIDIPTTLSWD